MTVNPLITMRRREFLKLAGALSAANLTHGALAAPVRRFAITIDAQDPVASSQPVRWAAEQLREAIAAKGATCEIVEAPQQVRGAAFQVLVAGGGSTLARGFPQTGAELSGAEMLRLTPGQLADAPAILVSGSDQRGFIYALLELAERVRFGSDPTLALHLISPIEDKPANEARSVGRYFCSELEDKPWYYDRDFWHGYLDLLVASRFNRFCLAFGLTYNFPRGVTGDYFLLPYPYLVDVPGYSGVRVVQLATPDGKMLATPRPLSEAEREKNLESLKFIAAQTAARGLHFQLGIWDHAYQWTDSPFAYHNIEGLTPETHAPYCRDALAMILKECPQIQGLTLRVHGESGITEGDYSFWKTLFEAISGCGRKVEIDMHAKGVSQTMIDLAVDTGMPVKLGAKFSAEHQSLGYEQEDIRAMETRKPREGRLGPTSLSEGSLLFTRYGYADFYKQGARYKLWYRPWPGTQRHLLSADPEMAAGYGRTAHFCGAAGLDLMEPLTFKGREGTGQPGGRCAYADASLNPAADWEKFAYYYRIWGRKLYDPDADPETWRRPLRDEFGPGAIPVETALANASRILPLLTSAHLAGVANQSFWPELYSNMPIVIGSEPPPSRDTPTPVCFGTVSPIDPQLFSTIIEHAADLLAGRSNPKYSPIEVAQWMEDFTATSSNALAEARRKAKAPASPGFRRMEEDVLIQIGLGRFFAAKMRSGVLYEIFQKTADAQAGVLALARYKEARQAWATMAARAATVYRHDITYGRPPMERGDWSDRLPAIDRDIEAMAETVEIVPAATVAQPHVARAIASATGRPVRRSVPCAHTPSESFQPGQPLSLALHLSGTSTETTPTAARLYYRHVNQAERWLSIEMEGSVGGYSAAIPADYTQSAYPLEYYFELQAGDGAAWLYPAFNSTLSNQPYYAIPKRMD
jgi:hypothetical protein